MKKEFIVSRSGKTFVLYAGLLDLAHENGLTSIVTTLVQAPSEANNRVAICSATVTIESEGVEKQFTGIGDAAPNNVAPAMQTCLLRMAECVPLSASILTRFGWKNHASLRLGEEVLAYDIILDRAVWTPLRAVTVYSAPQPVLSIKGRSVEFRCTPEHTWVSAGQRCRKQLVQTNLLPKTARILLAAEAEDGGGDISTRDAAILGWLITDGCIRAQSVSGKPYMRYSIYQSKPEQLGIIRNLLCDDATEHSAEPYERTFPTGKTYLCKESFRFDLKIAFARGLMERMGFFDYSDLPKIACRMSHIARAAMLSAMLLADGSKNTNSAGWTFSKKSKPAVMGVFEILATLEGHALGIPQIQHGDMPTRVLRSNNAVSRAYLTIEQATPEPVWCPTTDYGTWVMNLDGNIAITGNTRAKSRALRDAVNIGVAAFEELGPDTASAGDEEAPYVETLRPFKQSNEDAARYKEEQKRFTTRARGMGYEGKLTPLCGAIVNKHPVTAPDYGEALKCSAAEWNAAIDGIAAGNKEAVK